MSDTKHTPGPWKAWEDGVRAEDGTTVALVYAVDRDDGKRYGCGESDANARLIAAAPDLLEAAEELLGGCIFHQDHDESFGLAETLRTAIANARGERGES